MSGAPSLGWYRLLMRALTPFSGWVLDRRARAGKEDASRRHERLGQPDRRRPEGGLVWMHGASVGESLVLATLVEEMAGQRPDLNFLVTTGTVTSANMMADRLPSRALHQYVPLDTPKAVKGFLDHWSPDLAVFAESELWPNLISATHERGTPMALVNARMNEKSIRSWRRRREAARYLLGCFNWIGPADERTRSGISELLGNKPLDLVGNIKLEAKPMPPDPHELSRVRVALGGRPVWLAASTHSGEEGVALAANAMLKTRHPNTLLILAPRHPDRAGEIEKLMKRHGHSWARRSLDETPDTSCDVWLADTLGEMGLWYSSASASFIGGSLVRDIGGHNPIEASQLGSAVISGEHVASFQDVYDAYREHKAVSWVDDALTLSEAVEAIWEHAGPTSEGGMAAVRQLSGGALALTTQNLLDLLSEAEGEA